MGYKKELLTFRTLIGVFKCGEQRTGKSVFFSFYMNIAKKTTEMRMSENMYK